MARETQPYKRSMSSSIGSGMKSLLSGDGRRYFVIEHKGTSRFHHEGEEQQIIVDQAEIGRGSASIIRLDGEGHMFDVVSRRHAAIERVGDNWQLVNLSKSNPTILNGTQIGNLPQLLHNGDEIQLSYNGPKLCFKIPAGERGRVNSIGMTCRMNLFMQQALRPYRTAIMSLACALVIALGLGAWSWANLFREIQETNDKLAVLSTTDEEFERRLDQYYEIRHKDSVENARIAQEHQRQYRHEIEAERRKTNAAIAEAVERMKQMGNNARGMTAMLEEQNIYKDVYFLQIHKVVLVSPEGETVITKENGENYTCSGTGFLLNDGRFVTARHCIEPWYYEAPTGNEMVSKAVRAAVGDSERYQIKGYYVAISTLSETAFEFTSDDFIINRRMDKKVQVGCDENNQALFWNFIAPVDPEWSQDMWATDWAYTTHTEEKTGDLIADTELSKDMLPLQSLVALGFPQALGVGDGNRGEISPIPIEMKTSRRGLAANGCIMHSRGTDHGNSGGPIFAVKDGKLVVVGVVSRGDERSNEYNWAVPIANIYCQ